VTADEKPALPAHLACILENVDPSVPESVVDKLGQLLQKYDKAFSVNEYDLGWTDKIKHNRHGRPSADQTGAAQSAAGATRNH
jgi:rRNA-processing protein FCF1